MCENFQVSDSEDLDEESKASCANCHERIFQGSFEDQFHSGQVELHIDRSFWDKLMIEISGYFHGFYDQVANYIEHLRHNKPIKENFAGFNDPLE